MLKVLIMDTNTCFINIVVTRKSSQLNDGPSILEADIAVRFSEPSTPSPTTATKTAQNLQIFKKGPSQALISIALPSDDPTRYMARISVYTLRLETSLGERNGFDIHTNITEMRGSAWRSLINSLRAQFASVSREEEPPTEGEQTADVSEVDRSSRPSMDPRLIREFLGSDERPRSATWEHSCIPCSLVRGLSAFDVLTASDEPNTPLTFTVDFSAPNDYSQLDFVDLALTLSNDFSSQSSGSDGPIDADLVFLFQWIAVNASHNDHSLENHLEVVTEFISSLTSRYRSSHQITDFQGGIKLLRSSIVLCNPTVNSACSHPLFATLLDLTHEALFAPESPAEELDEIARWCSENIVKHISNGAALLNNLARLYMDRYTRFGNIRDLQNNIIILQAAIDSPPPANSERVYILLNITHSLRTRLTLLGRPTDLELVLEYCHEALKMEASGVKLVPRWELLHVLGDTLMATDLDGAVRALRESKELCPQGEQQRYSILYDLATALQKRNFAHDRQLVEDAKESSALESEALELATNATAGFDKCQILITHLFRELSRKNPSTLDDLSPYIATAIHAFQAVQTSPARHIALHALGVLYYYRFAIGEDAQDISTAHNCFFEALKIALSGSGYQNVARILSWLARVHLQSKGEFFNIPKAYEYLHLCINDTHCSAEDRLVFLAECMNDVTSGKNTLSISELQPSKLSQLYIRALRSTFFETTALEIDLKTGLDRLRRFGKLVSRTSLLCYESDEVTDAIQALEEGRSIFWQQVFRNRAAPPVDIPPELKQRLQYLSQQVEQIRFNEAHPSLYPSPTLEYSHRKRVSMEYDTLIKEIRKQPGSENFLALPIGDISEVSKHGPIVVLVPYPSFSVVYILYRKVLEDPNSFVLGHAKMDFTQSELQGYITQLGHANQRIRGEIGRHSGFTDIEKGEGGPVIPSQAGDLKRDGELRAVRTRMRAVDPFNGVLKDLWVKIVKIILDTINIKPSKGRDRPRVWWCPTGDFAFLPIHAAGDYSAVGECCSDYVVSSYTPTITALATARRAYKPILRTDITALLAAVPHPFQGTPLPDTANELQQVARIIPQGQRVPLPPTDDVLVDPRAGLSVPTAIAKLPDATILHLASHGVQDFDNPLNSGFLLRDAKLSLEQLMPIPLPNAFLAFLSACETAKGDQRYIDQAIHLAATMLFAGFKSVIGTMWSMSDIDGPLVASHIYDQIFSGEGEYLDPNVIPYALDEAVQRLRANRVPPSRWATFIHLGM